MRQFTHIYCSRYMALPDMEAMEAVAQMEQKILELKKVRVCQECGAEAADTADFCSVCGARLVIVAEDAFYEEADTKEQKKEDDIQIP